MILRPQPTALPHDLCRQGPLVSCLWHNYGQAFGDPKPQHTPLGSHPAGSQRDVSPQNFAVQEPEQIVRINGWGLWSYRKQTVMTERSVCIEKKPTR
jgi:hypothetical protein